MNFIKEVQKSKRRFVTSTMATPRSRQLHCFEISHFDEIFIIYRLRYTVICSIAALLKARYGEILGDMYENRSFFTPSCEHKKVGNQAVSRSALLMAAEPSTFKKRTAILRCTCRVLWRDLGRSPGLTFCSWFHPDHADCKVVRSILLLLSALYGTAISLNRYYG